MSTPTTTTSTTETDTDSEPKVLETAMLSSALSLLLFVIGTLIFLIAKSTMRNTSPITISTMYFLGLIITQGYVNLRQIDNKCGKPDYYLATKMTILPWVFIFGLLFICLSAFPAWKRPFSNSFGYLVVKILNINGILTGKNGIIKQNEKGGNPEAYTAIKNLYNDPSLLVNELNPENFDAVIYNMREIFKAPDSDETKKNIGKLKDMVNIKDAVSETIWYGLTGLVAISASQTLLADTICPS